MCSIQKKILRYIYFWIYLNIYEYVQIIKFTVYLID